MNGKSQVWWLAVGMAVVVTGAALGAPTPLVLGHVMGAALEVDGVAVPSGATLVAPTSLATGSTPAVVYLANRTTLQLAEHSSVAFDAAANGDIAVAVAAGTLSVGGPDGTTASYGADAALLLDENGQTQPVGEGAQVSRGEVALCDLKNTSASEVTTCKEDPRDSVCRWELIKVDGSEVQPYLDRGARYQGQDGLDCRDRAGALFIPAAAAAGMSSGAVAGIVAGSVLGAVVINEEVIDDDDQPASP